MQVYLDLIELASKQKAINNVRYILALRQINHNGYVNLDEAIPKLSVNFRVKPKTVKNRLWVCHNAGLGTLHKESNRFYYFSQKKMIEAMGGTLKSETAVYINDFSGSVVDVRARFLAALMTGKSPDITITRKNIKNLSGRAKKTQRRYEKINGTKVTENYARMTEYESEYDLARLRYLGYAPFVNNGYITRQLANSYSTAGFKKGRRRCREHPNNIVESGSVKTTQRKIYHENVKSALKEYNNIEYGDVYVWNSKAKTWEWLRKEKVY